MSVESSTRTLVFIMALRNANQIFLFNTADRVAATTTQLFPPFPVKNFLHLHGQLSHDSIELHAISLELKLIHARQLHPLVQSQHTYDE